MHYFENCTLVVSTLHLFDIFCRKCILCLHVNEATESTYIINHSCVFFHAQLMQSEVDSYDDSIPSSRQLEVHWQKTESPYKCLSHPIDVTGIRGITTITITRHIDSGKRIWIQWQSLVCPSNLSVGHVRPVVPHVVTSMLKILSETMIVTKFNWIIVDHVLNRN